MKPWLLLLTITLEGYVVLAMELLAIRQLTPFTGSSTDTISIIIAAVLLPLAIGYHVGGNIRSQSPDIIRLRLARNLLVAGAIFTLGFIYLHVGMFFEILASLGVSNRLLKTVLYVALFLVYPTYLLGQTIPLASQAMPADNLARLTGRMLFYSTLGSFLGSVVSTIILMAWLGVHNTFTFTLTVLMGLVILLTGKARHAYTLCALALVLYTVNMNGTAVLERLHIVQNNAYNLVAVYQSKAGKILSVNGSSSSLLSSENPPRSFTYVDFINTNILKLLPSHKPHHILVIGAGGFTLGLQDHVNHYTYLDIDRDLKTTSEKHFLGHTLGNNKHFVAQSARSFLRNTEDTYDVIVVDAFTNRKTIPAELVTQEFFQEVRLRLNPGGIMAANIIASPSFESAYSRAIDTTIRSVFPFVSRQIVLSPGLTYSSPESNLIYTAIQPQTPIPASSPKPYTDTLNRYFLHH
jgi:spermidine synthase